MRVFKPTRYRGKLVLPYERVLTGQALGSYAWPSPEVLPNGQHAEWTLAAYDLHCFARLIGDVFSNRNEQPRAIR